MSARIKITDLVLNESFACVDGYITLQSLVAIVTARSLIAGSCNAMMSICFSVSLALLIKSCWHILDLLTFCCQILRLLKSLFILCVRLPNSMLKGYQGVRH